MGLDLKDLSTGCTESQFATTFLPKFLKKGGLYDCLLRSFDNKEAEMEVRALTLSQTCAYRSLLKSIENSFWVYGNVKPYSGQSYTLCFKSLVIKLFNNRNTNLINTTSLKYVYFARKQILKSRKTIFKSRFLALTKKGLKFNFYGQSVTLKPPFKRGFIKRVSLSKKSKFVKRKIRAGYRSWRILSFNFIGFLSSFQITDFDLQFLKSLKTKKKKFDKKWDCYYNGKLALKLKIKLKRS